MSHFEIAVTVYSVLSTIGMGLTVYYGRLFLLAIEQGLHDRLVDEFAVVCGLVKVESARTRVKAERAGADLHTHIDTAKADISRVEKWIFDHAEELKNRAEDLRVRALDLHDKTQTSITRQPPTR